MALNQTVLQALQKALEAVQIEGKPAIDFIKEVDAKADGVEKVQTANQEISEERKKLKSENKRLIDEIETIKPKLLSEAELSEYRLLKEKGMTSVKEADYNKITTSLQDLQAKLDAEVKLRKENDEQLKMSKINEAHQKLFNKVSTALVGVGINKALTPAMALVKDQKLVNVEVDASGKITEIITIPKNGTLVTATENELAEYLAGTYDFLVDSSGKRGAGAHNDVNNRQNSYNTKDDFAARVDKTLSGIK